MIQWLIRISAIFFLLAGLSGCWDAVQSGWGDFAAPLRYWFYGVLLLGLSQVTSSWPTTKPPDPSGSME